MRQKITDSLRLCGFCKPIYNLITLNTSKRFVIVLFANGDALSNLSVSSYHAFYQQLSKQISPEMSIYIGNFISFSEMRSEIHRIDTFVANNVNKKPSLYFTEQEKNFATSMDVADNIAHWNRLLNSEQYEKLLESILSYLDFIASLNVTNLKTLCDLHQQLTQLFFIYAYQHEIDVTSLFTEEYSYNEYMDAFKDTSALRKAVSFIIPAIHVSSGSDSEKGAVSLAKKYITNNVSLNLSVKDVADYVHLSPEYFTKLFKKEVGQNVIIVGGGLTGCEIAYDLYLQGKNPTIIEMKNDLIAIPGVCLANSSYLREFFKLHKVPVYLETAVDSITEDGVVIKCKDGTKEAIQGDDVIMSVGYLPAPLANSGNAPLVGDCKKVGNLRTVIWGAWDVAMKL